MAKTALNTREGNAKMAQLAPLMESVIMAPEIEELLKDGGKDTTMYALRARLRTVAHSSKFPEMRQIVAILHDVTVEEVDEQPYSTTMKWINECLDGEFVQFFFS